MPFHSNRAVEGNPLRGIARVNTVQVLRQLTVRLFRGMQLIDPEEGVPIRAGSNRAGASSVSGLICSKSTGIGGASDIERRGAVQVFGLGV